jgi:hypothetical protein
VHFGLAQIVQRRQRACARVGLVDFDQGAHRLRGADAFGAQCHGLREVAGDPVLSSIFDVVQSVQKNAAVGVEGHHLDGALEGAG